MIGRTPSTDWIWPEDFGALGEMFLRLRAHPGAVETMTARFRRGDGEYRWVEMIAVNQLDDPAVRGIVTNSRDITDRVDADAAIRASEERLQALVASASDVISVIDADGKLRYSSAVTTHVLGYPEGAGYGEYIFDLVHPDDQPIDPATCSNAVRDVRGHAAPVRGAVAARRRVVDVRRSPREQPARRPVGHGHRRHDPRHHRTQAGRGRAARERAAPPRGRSALPRRRRRPDRARVPVPPGHDAHVREPRVRGVLRAHPVGAARLPAHRRVRTDRTRGRGGAPASRSGPATKSRCRRTGSTRQGGTVHWYQWTDRAFLDDEGKVVEFQSVGRDITDRRRAAVLTSHQAEILEQVARGVPLDETLATIAAHGRGPLPGSRVRGFAARRRRRRRCGSARARACRSASATRSTSSRSDRAAARAAPPRTGAPVVAVADIWTDPLWGELPRGRAGARHPRRVVDADPRLRRPHGARHARRVLARRADARRRAPADPLPARAPRVDRHRAQGVRRTARAPVDARPADRAAEPAAVPRPA